MATDFSVFTKKKIQFLSLGASVVSLLVVVSQELFDSPGEAAQPIHMWLCVIFAVNSFIFWGAYCWQSLFPLVEIGDDEVIFRNSLLRIKKLSFRHPQIDTVSANGMRLVVERGSSPNFQVDLHGVSLQDIDRIVCLMRDQSIQRKIDA